MTAADDTTSDSTLDTTSDNDRGGDALAGSHQLTDFGPGVFGQQQAGWLVTIETPHGLVQIDTGDQGQGSIAAIRRRSDAPFHAIVFSHGHQRYNLAAREFVVDSVQRCGVVPRVIAHANVPRRQRRYLESNGLQNRILERQFRYPSGSLGDRQFAFTSPSETFHEMLTIATPGRTIEVTWAPSETDDAIAAWIVEDRILYGGPACIPFMPNVGSPQRTLRDPVRWADTLDRLAAYPAERLVCEFGPPIDGREAVAEYLTSTAAALRWCHTTVVGLMNAGHTAHEIGIAITDPPAVLAHVRQLAERGEVKLALHVVDLLALDGGAAPHTVEARALKAELCRRAATEVTRSYVSQSLYLHAAEMLDRADTTAVG
jgi:glyoxylase-like metal-dependent hydrolase (beta-lactamase superfamily II)